MFLSEKIFISGTIQEKKQIPHLGDSFLGWVFIIKNEDIDYIEGEKSIFLKNILKALNLSVENVLLASEQFIIYNHLFVLQKHIPLKNIILFGVHPQQVGINFDLDKNNLHQINDLKVVMTDAISTIEASQELKKKLWTNLQKMNE